MTRAWRGSRGCAFVCMIGLLFGVACCCGGEGGCAGYIVHSCQWWGELGRYDKLGIGLTRGGR